MKIKVDNFIKSNKISASKKSVILKFKDKRFHFDGTWNRLLIEGEVLFLEKLVKKDNGFEFELFSKIILDDIGDYFFIMYNGIPLFLKLKNRQLQPVYISNIIDRLSFNKDKHIPYFDFYKSLGIKTYIRSIDFNVNSINPYKLTEY